MQSENLRRPDPHQITAKTKIRLHDGIFGLGMAPGTGKTLVAIRSTVAPCLVICRRDDFQTWRDELEMEGQAENDALYIDEGSVELPSEGSLPAWTIITYDLVKNRRIFKWLKSMPFKHVNLDEFHWVKHWSSQRAKAVYRTTRHIPRRVGMTGSAIGNDLKDIFAMSLILDDGKLFGKNEYWFHKKYYIKMPYGGWVLKRGAKEEIMRRLKQLWYYVHEDSVLKLPPVRPIMHSVPMTGMQRRYYEQVIEEWELRLDSGEVIELDYIIVQIAKLKQIASGFFYDEERNPHWLRNNKIPFLFKALTDKDYYGKKKKIVIWCSHSAEIEAIAGEAKKRGIGFVVFYGKKKRLKDRARKLFRDKRRVRLFIAQVDSGVGMNELTVADTAIYYSNSRKVVSRQQSMRRTRRRGSEIHKECIYADICTENTVDVPLRASLMKMMDFAHTVMSACAGGSRVRDIIAYRG